MYKIQKQRMVEKALEMVHVEEEEDLTWGHTARKTTWESAILDHASCSIAYVIISGESMLQSQEFCGYKQNIQAY